MKSYKVLNFQRKVLKKEWSIKNLEYYNFDVNL